MGDWFWLGDQLMRWVQAGPTVLLQWWDDASSVWRPVAGSLDNYIWDANGSLLVDANGEPITVG